MKLKDLVGTHILSGIETGNLQNKDYNNSFYVKFTLDGITYMAIEDPEDGYRSCMEEIKEVKSKCHTPLPDIKVLISHNEGDYQDKDIMEMRDAINGKMVLQLGTENVGDWYPQFVYCYMPEHFDINKDVTFTEDLFYKEELTVEERIDNLEEKVDGLQNLSEAVEELKETIESLKSAISKLKNNLPEKKNEKLNFNPNNRRF